MSDPIREVLAAWIIALSVLTIGLSVLAIHERDVRDNGIAAVLPQWYAPPVASAEDWNEMGWEKDIPPLPKRLSEADRGTDPTITQARGDSTSWCYLSNPVEEEPSNC